MTGQRSQLGHPALKPPGGLTTLLIENWLTSTEFVSTPWPKRQEELPGEVG